MQALIVLLYMISASSFAFACVLTVRKVQAAKQARAYEAFKAERRERFRAEGERAGYRRAGEHEWSNR